jgi:ABC-type multidrug transport system permease subunit
MAKRKPWRKPVRIVGPEDAGPAPSRPRRVLVPALLALQFALFNAGAFILAVAEVGSMSSLFGLMGTHRLALHHKEAIILMGGGVFALSLGFLLVGVVKGTSGLEEDGCLYGFLRVTYLCVSFGFLFACMLLSILVAAWLLKFLIPEIAAMVGASLLVVGLFAVPFLERRS